MYILKVPKSQKGFGVSLSQILSKNTTFKLEKVKGVREISDRLDYLLAKETKGMYICQLRSLAMTSKHVVGVDCDNGWIYDCMEIEKLPLSLESFNYCCGEHENGIKEIASWAKFIHHRQKRQHNREKIDILEV